jgi:hypothetical protein
MKIPRKGTDTRKIVSKDEKKSDSSSTFQVLSSELRRNTTLAPSENNTDDTFLVPKFASKFPNDSSAVPFIVPDVPVAQTDSKSSSPDDNDTFQPLQLKKETYLAQELTSYRPPLLVLETDETFLLPILPSTSTVPDPLVVATSPPPLPTSNVEKGVEKKPLVPPFLNEFPTVPDSLTVRSFSPTPTLASVQTNSTTKFLNKFSAFPVQSSVASFSVPTTFPPLNDGKKSEKKPQNIDESLPVPPFLNDSSTVPDSWDLSPTPTLAPVQTNSTTKFLNKFSAVAVQNSVVTSPVPITFLPLNDEKRIEKKPQNIDESLPVPPFLNDSFTVPDSLAVRNLTLAPVQTNSTTNFFNSVDFKLKQKLLEVI